MNPLPRSAFIDSGPWALGWVLAAKESNGWDITQVLVTQSCLTLCHPRTVAHQAPPSVGILQARILEWATIPFSRGSSWPRNATWVSCIAGRFFTSEPPAKPKGPRQIHPVGRSKKEANVKDHAQDGFLGWPGKSSSRNLRIHLSLPLQKGRHGTKATPLHLGEGVSEAEKPLNKPMKDIFCKHVMASGFMDSSFLEPEA